MDKKEKNDGLRTAGLGSALGAAAGVSASIIPDNAPTPPPSPEPAKPEPAKPEPAPKPRTEPEKTDVITDPDNPLDLEDIALEIGDITDINPDFHPAEYGPNIVDPYDPIIINEDLYGGPVGPEDINLDDDTLEEWDIPECVYAGPMTNEEIYPDTDDFDDTIDPE